MPNAEFDVAADFSGLLLLDSKAPKTDGQLLGVIRSVRFKLIASKKVEIRVETQNVDNRVLSVSPRRKFSLVLMELGLIQ